MKRLMLIVTISILIVLGLRYRESSESPPASSSSEMKSPSSSSPSPKLIEQIKEHPGLKVAQLSSDEKASECKAALELIETLPFRSLVSDLTNGQLKLDPRCMFLKTKPFQKLDGFPQVCEDVKDGALSRDCLDKLLYYKALRIHYGTLDADLSSLPNEVVIQKLMALLLENAFQTDDGLKLLKAVGEEVYRRLPWSEPAAKAATIGYFVAHDRSAEDDARFEALLREARGKFPESWELFEMEVTRKKLKNDLSYKDDVRNLYRQYPETALAMYYRGCLYWAESQATEARDLFRRATEASPGDRRLSKTLQESLSKVPPEFVCSIHIGVNPDDF